jgi:hypothetical protein
MSSRYFVNISNLENNQLVEVYDGLYVAGGYSGQVPTPVSLNQIIKTIQAGDVISYDWGNLIDLLTPGNNISFDTDMDNKLIINVTPDNKILKSYKSNTNLIITTTQEITNLSSDVIGVYDKDNGNNITGSWAGDGVKQYKFTPDGTLPGNWCVYLLQ